MKKCFYIHTLLFLILICCSCDIVEKDKGTPSPELTDVGFTGQMSWLNIFINQSPMISDNSFIVSTPSPDDGTYSTRCLILRNNMLMIMIELPYIKTDDTIVRFSEGNFQNEILSYGNEKYPFSTVKNFLNLGNKDIAYNGDYRDIFKVVVLFHKDNKTFQSDQNQEGHYLKVVDLIEGKRTKSSNEEIRTLDVTFEMDTKMFYCEPEGPKTYFGNMKGVLKMRYEEKK